MAIDEGYGIGVALSSGGASSLAHIGALEALLEAGVRVDVVAGTSGGSVVGAVLAAGSLAPFREAVTGFTPRRVSACSASSGLAEQCSSSDPRSTSPDRS